MTDEADAERVEIADPYAHLTPVLADAVDGGETITHSDDPPVRVGRSKGETKLWSVIVDDELVTSFSDDAWFTQSTADLGVWIDGVVDWWTAEEKTQPPGFERGGSAFA